MSDTHDTMTSADGRLTYHVSRIPDDASPRLKAKNAKLRQDVAKAIVQQEKGAPEWRSTIVPKWSAWPRRSPQRIVELYGDTVTYEEIEESEL